MLTRTYTVLHVSAKVYDEIRRLLTGSGYADRIHTDFSGEYLDLAGLAFQEHHGFCPFCFASMIRCRNCGTVWCSKHDGQEPRLPTDVCHQCGNKGVDCT